MAVADQKPRLRRPNGQFAPRADVSKEAVKADYGNRELLIDEVADKNETSVSTVHRMRVANGWEQRAPRKVDPNDLLMRLFEVLETQIKDMEKNMTKAGSMQSTVLGKMVGTLDRMIALKNKAEAAKPSRRLRGPEIDALRAKIAEKIAEFSGV